AHVVQELERLIQPEEERERPHVGVEEERIAEVDGRQVGVRVPALDLGLPEQAGQRSDSDEQDNRPQEEDRTALHRWHLSWLVDSSHSTTDIYRLSISYYR